MHTVLRPVHADDKSCIPKQYGRNNLVKGVYESFGYTGCNGQVQSNVQDRSANSASERFPRWVAVLLRWRGASGDLTNRRGPAMRRDSAPCRLPPRPTRRCRGRPAKRSKWCGDGVARLKLGMTRKTRDGRGRHQAESTATGGVGRFCRLPSAWRTFYAGICIKIHYL